MNLKLKKIDIDSPKIIILVNEQTAQSLNLHIGDRVTVSYGNRRVSSDVDTTSKLVKHNELAVSEESLKSLGAKEGDLAKLWLTPHPKSLKYILRKLDGYKLSKEEIYLIISEIVNNTLNEIEIAYFVSGVYEKGMDLEETVNLTDAICRTGNRLKWPTDQIADKHSIGGVAGNRTTPIVVSICAAAGITLPKTSSRSITSAAGTADVVEVITKVDFPAKELKRIVKKTGACLAWGGSLGLAPADDKLIKVERLLNVDPDSQLIASILAKKLSVGSKYVLIDIPYGPGAKVNKSRAVVLREKFISVGRKFGLNINVILTDGREPIGNGIGPVLEILDVLKVLKRENPPRDLEDKSLTLAGALLEMMGKSKKGKGREKAQEILNSKQALKKFEEIINAQGKKKVSLIPARFSQDIVASREGKVKTLDNKSINNISKILGCPQDQQAGIYLYKHCNSKVCKGEKIMTLYSNSPSKLKEALEEYSKSSASLIY